MTKLKWFHVICGALMLALSELQVAQVFPQEWAGVAAGVIGCVLVALQFLNSNVPVDGPMIDATKPPAQ